MPNLYYACMQIVSQEQQNILVHVLRCDSPRDTRHNPAKEFLAVKLKQLGCVSFTNYHWINSNVTN